LKKSSFFILISIVLTVYALVNYYIFITGWHAIPLQYRTVYFISYMFLFLSYIIGRFMERRFLNWVSAVFVWIGSFWLGAMVYFLLFILSLDIIRLVNFIIPFFPQAIYSNYENTKLLAFAVIFISVFIIILAGFLNARSPVIKNLDITINKPGNKFQKLKIAVASDIHLGTVIRKSRLEKIVKIINSLNPDLVLLPGDVVDEDIGPVIKQNHGETIRKIKSRYGVYAVTGNHEYIGGAEAACNYLEEHNIIEIRDSSVKIHDSLYIIGREDRSSKGFAGKTRKTLENLLEGVDKNLPLILMDHQPVHLEEAQNNGIDLQLSGHTHHGQLWPFNFITKKVYELSRGYKIKGNTQYFVSCGVGTWGPPIRTGNRPEIINLTINFA
jgi:predicted MPP superfamily phosphohydrolase